MNIMRHQSSSLFREVGSHAYGLKIRRHSHTCKGQAALLALPLKGTMVVGGGHG